VRYVCVMSFVFLYGYAFVQCGNRVQGAINAYSSLRLVKIVDFSVSVSRPDLDFVAHLRALNASIDSAEAKSS
jgi:hypothetical protein